MKKYETPIAEITMFESEDILTTSQITTKSRTDAIQSEDNMILGQKGYFGLGN